MPATTHKLKRAAPRCPPNSTHTSPTCSCPTRTRAGACGCDGPNGNLLPRNALTSPYTDVEVQLPKMTRIYPTGTRMDARTHRSLYESRGLSALAPLVRRRARMLLDETCEAAEPSAGIYYVARFADRWEIYPYAYAEFPEEIDHLELWEGLVAPTLAHSWAPRLGRTPAELERALRLHTYAFPRGRVCAVPGTLRFTVLHGADTRPFMGVTPQLIERLFGLAGRCAWEEDEHEHCQTDDCDAVRELLRLPRKERWFAV